MSEQLLGEKVSNLEPEINCQIKEDSDSSDLNTEDEQFLENALKLGMASKK